MPNPELIVCTYVWIDASSIKTRCKCRVLPAPLSENVEDYPWWNFDGSSTGQATRENSDVLLKPVAIYRDPFLRPQDCILLCETYDAHSEPLKNNNRSSCLEIVKLMSASVKPLFGIEQEYTLLTLDGKLYGDKKSNSHYCGVGAKCSSGRAVCDDHLLACLRAGVVVSGTNAEVVSGQWEFQVGPSAPIKVSDDLWVARYLLDRVGEKHGIVIDYTPKLFEDANGSGAHVNFSTEDSRQPGGICYLREAIKKLESKHLEHMECYDINKGEDNRKRLTGNHETAHFDTFTSAEANRGASIRIPHHVVEDQCGYLEDRRPASNCDPYLVTAMILKTICLS